MNKPIICAHESASYICIDLKEVETLEISPQILNFAIKNDHSFFLHADCLNEISDAYQKAQKEFNPAYKLYDDLSFLDGTVKYINSNKPSKH